jgi:hypothetical protein
MIEVSARRSTNNASHTDEIEELTDPSLENFRGTLKFRVRRREEDRRHRRYLDKVETAR